ncbi:MAG: hypothetical protein QME12_06850 [Nanoarchaeota archaeon]|nr:hypothetical protein [Nanoarchaeota archaeon]
MDLTYKIIIAVIVGLLVFYIMKTMTKWAFRIIIALLFIAGLFYMYQHVDDIKAIFNEEMVTVEVRQSEEINITETNITAEQAGESQPEEQGAPEAQPSSEPPPA